MRCSNRLLTVLGAYAFGLVPFIVNLLSNIILGTASYYSVFIVAELMYFTLNICWVTMQSLYVESQQLRFVARFLTLFVFLFIALVAVVLLMLSPHFIVEPPASGLYRAQVHRFIGSGISLASFALVFGLAIETWLCCQNNRSPRKNKRRPRFGASDGRSSS